MANQEIVIIDGEEVFFDEGSEEQQLDESMEDAVEQHPDGVIAIEEEPDDDIMMNSSSGDDSLESDDSSDCGTSTYERLNCLECSYVLKLSGQGFPNEFPYKKIISTREGRGKKKKYPRVTVERTGNYKKQGHRVMIRAVRSGDTDELLCQPILDQGCDKKYKMKSIGKNKIEYEWRKLKILQTSQRMGDELYGLLVIVTSWNPTKGDELDEDDPYLIKNLLDSDLILGWKFSNPIMMHSHLDQLNRTIQTKLRKKVVPQMLQSMTIGPTQVLQHPCDPRRNEQQNDVLTDTIFVSFPSSFISPEGLDKQGKLKVNPLGHLPRFRISGKKEELNVRFVTDRMVKVMITNQWYVSQEYANAKQSYDEKVVDIQKRIEGVKRKQESGDIWHKDAVLESMEQLQEPRHYWEQKNIDFYLEVSFDGGETWDDFSNNSIRIVTWIKELQVRPTHLDAASFLFDLGGSPF